MRSPRLPGADGSKALASTARWVKVDVHVWTALGNLCRLTRPPILLWPFLDTPWSPLPLRVADGPRGHRALSRTPLRLPHLAPPSMPSTLHMRRVSFTRQVNAIRRQAQRPVTERCAHKLGSHNDIFGNSLPLSPSLWRVRLKVEVLGIISIGALKPSIEQLWDCKPFAVCEGCKL